MAPRGAASASHSPEIEQLLGIVDRAYDKRSWHGTNLRGSIRGLTADAAGCRPARGRHSIQEIVVHAAYWKYAVRRRLLGEQRGSFALEGSNWFERRGTEEATWRADVALLERTHRELRAAIEGVRPEDLHRALRGGAVTTFDLIAGIAAHDLYHAGQIQLIKRLRAD